MTKTALVSEITGQDCWYLAELLLDRVTASWLPRRSNTAPDERIVHRAGKLELTQGDLLDHALLVAALRDVEPNEAHTGPCRSFRPDP